MKGLSRFSCLTTAVLPALKRILTVAQIQEGYVGEDRQRDGFTLAGCRSHALANWRNRNGKPRKRTCLSPGWPVVAISTSVSSTASALLLNSNNSINHQWFRCRYSKQQQITACRHECVEPWSTDIPFDSQPYSPSDVTTAISRIAGPQSERQSNVDRGSRKSHSSRQCPGHKTLNPRSGSTSGTEAIRQSVRRQVRRQREQQLRCQKVHLDVLQAENMTRMLDSCIFMT